MAKRFKATNPEGIVRDFAKGWTVRQSQRYYQLKEGWEVPTSTLNKYNMSLASSRERGDKKLIKLFDDIQEEMIEEAKKDAGGKITITMVRKAFRISGKRDTDSLILSDKDKKNIVTCFACGMTVQFIKRSLNLKGIPYDEINDYNRGLAEKRKWRQKEKWTLEFVKARSKYINHLKADKINRFIERHK